MPSAASPTPSVPLHDRARLALLAFVVAALTFVAALWLVFTFFDDEGQPAGMAWLLVAALCAPVVAALVGLLAARWGDRVELLPDRAVRWQRGRSEEFFWRNLECANAQLASVFAGAGLRMVFGDRRVLAVAAGDLEALGPAVRASNEVILSRWFAHLRMGGEITCHDAARFPWAWTLWSSVPVLGSLLRGGERSSRVDLWLRLAALAGVGHSVWTAVRTWQQARRTGGLRVSLAGFAPLKEPPESESLVPAPYRESAAPAGWTPWSAVEGASIEQLSLMIRVRGRPDPVVLSGATHNLFALFELMRVIFDGAVPPEPRRD